MGGSSSKHIDYGVFVGDEKSGSTRALRHPDIGEKDLVKVPTNGVITLWEGFQASVQKHGDRPFLGTRNFISKDKYGNFEWKTYKEVNEIVTQVATAYQVLDMIPEIESPINGKFRFLGIYSKNREEWIISDLAAHLNAATVVTFYDTLGDHTIEYILEQTKLTSIVIESKSLKKLNVLKKENKSGDLKNIIMLDLEDESIVKESEFLGFKVYTFPDLIKIGKENKVDFSPAKPDTISTFCYTSGTTGTPKGAMISHKGIVSVIASLDYTSIDFTENDVHLSYLPLAHVMERVVLSSFMFKGISVGFFTGNPAKLMEDAQTLKPTIFIGVPRVYQRIYDTITSGMNKLGFIKKSLAERAVASKLAAYRKNGTLTSSIWDRLVFGKSKAALGGNVRVMLTGSAPISPDMLDFLKICFCCPILEGYGQTESCAASSITRSDDNIPGHVGGPIAAIEVKLLDCESLDYFSTDKNEKGESQPRGEICFRGNSVFSSYFNDQEKTKEVFTEDGWLRTGDIGMIMPDSKAIKIIDRVKNIFKLSHGEYIAPEKLENVYLKCPYVSQIFVYGDSLENFLVAVVVPSKQECVNFLKAKGVEASMDNIEDHYDNKELVGDILKEMETLGRGSGLKGFEIIKKVHLTKDTFTIENEMLTPTMKLRRNDAKKKFLDVIKKLYSN